MLLKGLVLMQFIQQLNNTTADSGKLMDGNINNMELYLTMTLIN